MPAILLFLLLIAPESQAQKRLTPETFQVNVRPVLQGILSDFYQMITLFPDLPREMVPLLEAMNTLHTDKEVLKVSCPGRIDDKCLKSVDSIRSKLTTIHERAIGLYSKSRPSAGPYLSSLSALRVISDFHARLMETKGLLDNASFLLNAKIRPETSSYPIIKQLDELSTLLSLTLVEFIPYSYREDFRHFYFNFVQPIQLHISKHRNHEIFYRNVNSLNFTLNLLNQNLTKRNKKTPDGMAPYLATIHNRWNSLLRYYF